VRRLGAEPVGVLFAARAGAFPAPGVPELALSGLAPSAAAALLAEHGAVLDAGARQRVLDEAVGNALGRVELPAAHGADAACGGPCGARHGPDGASRYPRRRRPCWTVRPTRTGAPGISRRRPWAPTNGSPPSWNGPRHGPARAAATRPRPPRTSGPRSCPRS